MFSFRRKPSKTEETPRIRTSPSLPTLSSQGIPWPENLVDVEAIRRVDAPETPPAQGAAKVSLQAPDRTPIPFHKPFRPSPGKPGDGPISSLYMSSPPPAFDNRKSAAPNATRYSQRRARVPPTFNLMVCTFPFTLLCVQFLCSRSSEARELARPVCCACCWRRRMCLLPPQSTSGLQCIASYAGHPKLLK